MYDVILIGGLSYDYMGRTIGPFRLRTAAEKAGYRLKVIDFAWAFDENELLSMLGCLITNKTRVLAISAAWFDIRVNNSNRWATQSFFDKFKELYPTVTIITGCSKLNADPILIKNAKWFVNGFGDIAFIKLLDYLFAKSTDLKYETNNHLNVIYADRDYPARDVDQIETVLKIEDDFKSYQPIPIEVSRGCIFKCAFCSHPFLGRKTYDYIRSAESIGTELKRNFDLFGTYRYIISDDTFNDSMEKLDIVAQAIEFAKLDKFEFVGYIRPELLVTKQGMIEKLALLGLKGAHFGIESFNDRSRKVVGKGMPIQRILDATEQVRSYGVKIHASIIVGLPGNSEDEIYNSVDFLISNQYRYFNSWFYHELALQKGVAEEKHSLIEKNPELYGIKTFNENNSIWLGWESQEGMTSNKAKEIAKLCNEKSIKYQQFAGWTLARAWFHNIPQSAIEHNVIDSARLTVMSNGFARAKINYNRIIANKHN